jgi:anaerobic selenocysteine-containing dehydrogenase
MGLGQVPPAVFDGLVLKQLVTPALAASRFAGALGIDELLEAVGKEPGFERAIDALLRIGPYGEGCGREPGGLTLARVKAAEHGLDLGPLAPQLPGALVTASGKVELAPQRMRDDLSRLEAQLARAATEPLRLINRRDARSMNSWLHNVPALAKGRERCTLKIHPRDAGARGIAEGMRVRLIGRVGALEVPAEITDEVMPGVVSLPHGFGHRGEGVALRVATQRPGANVNAVSDDLALDAASGAGAIFGQEVEVEAIA